MKIMIKNRLNKSFVGTTLCFSLLASGILWAAPHSAYAATRYTAAKPSTNTNDFSKSTKSSNSTGSSNSTNMSDSIGSSLADDIITTGESFMGVRYKLGASSNSTKAFDCSSFTQYVFGQNGISLPRSSQEQSHVGTFVPKSQLQPGDLVFFYSPIHHVGIYMGNGKVLHTYGSPGVTITDMTSNWWENNYATARRVIKQ